MNLSTKKNKVINMENRLLAKGQEGREQDGLGVWDWQMQTITFRMDKQQGPNPQHRELYGVSCDKS